MSKKGGGSGTSMEKVAFYTLIVLAIILLVEMLLRLLKVDTGIIGLLKDIALLIAIVFMGIHAWRFVARKEAVWKVLFFICLGLVIAFIFVPAIAERF